MPPCTHAPRRSRSDSACWHAAASPRGGRPWPALTPGTSTAAPARQPPGMHPAQAADLPAPVAAELINVLAALALAGTATTSPSP